MLDQKIIKMKYKDNYSEIFENFNFLSENFKNEKNLLSEAEEMANLIIGLKLDSNSVVSALYIPFVCSNLIDLKNITNLEVYILIEKFVANDILVQKYSDADGLKEMLIGISKDIRVIILKICQTLIFARKNVFDLKNKETIKVFKAIDDIYAPISARLGLSEIKSELQDLSFEFHKPETYKNLKIAVKNETRASNLMISNLIDKVKKIVNENSIDCKCYGRIKHLSSIFNKMQNKDLSLDNIYDISAIRILVKTIPECYSVLGIIHSNFQPVDGRFKDYITSPKPNGYKSLHTTILFDSEYFEIQIRTFEMHEFAEYGVAAHFLYKEHKKALARLDNKLLWIRRLLENKGDESADTLLQELKTDVYLGEIFVQSPMGKVVKLLEGSTPIDFAYAIHSDIGNKCVGAKVNGIIVPLTEQLENSDVVEILTSPSSKGPSKDWLKIVKMPSTREKINYYFKKQNKEENAKLGKSMVEQYCKNNDILFQGLLNEKYVSVVLRKSAFVSLDELYAAIGYGSLTAEKFVKRLQSLMIADKQQNSKVFDNLSKKEIDKELKSEIIGTNGALTKYCKCCNPIPGDDIIGYVSRGRGIIIHKTNCETISKLSSNRFIKVCWSDDIKENLFVSYINVVAQNRANIYSEITNAISNVGVKVISLNTNYNKKGEIILNIGILIKDKDMLQKVKNKLSSIKFVFEVK